MILAFTILAASAQFSPINGALQSFTDEEGVELVEPASEMFTLSLLDDAGNETVFRSSEFDFVRR